MLNLLMNACDAMSASAADGRRLTIRTRMGDGGVLIAFADRGPGFRAEDYEKLFQPFYTTKPHGLGLGLSISRSIITAHGGNLWGTVGLRPGRHLPHLPAGIGPWSNYCTLAELIQSPGDAGGDRG